ncbi:hypothetical protein AB0C29_29730, partial [Actinoplanes sp. NPDC048791]|uniref:hypothetical protein n=1 Tax=Actinoplanes sp. NPDC048791 TaxID=3154623 RepID=UPI0033DE9A71
AGNAAVVSLLRGRSAAVAQRCGPVPCDCPPEEKAAAAVQRQPGPSLFDLGKPAADQLRFTNRMFLDASLPTECPRCHRDRPTAPMPPHLVDRDATEPRLVTWGGESEKALHTGGTVREVQLQPGATDRLVDDYGTGLIKRITSTHEFEGSEAARTGGAETIRRRWPDIRPGVRDGLTSWYQTELLTAVGMTPKLAAPVLEPERLRAVLTTHHGQSAPLGRWDAVAVPGQRIGVFQITDIGAGQIWFHLPDRPLWMYQISQGDFIRGHDPFVTAVVEQVQDKTKWILEATPLLLKVGAFALGFSGSIALVIAGIALDELATEMQADAEGRKGRDLMETLGSAGTQVLIDRIFHGLFGGGAGRAAAGAGKLGAKIEHIAEKSLPAIRRELAQAEKPLVRQALDAGTARKVTDRALRREGYLTEVVVESGGQKHIFRLHERGTWCRFSTTVCGLDLGADVAAAARSPKSFTQGRLEARQDKLTVIRDEAEFLRAVHARMKQAGKMDLSLLDAAERARLAEIVDDPAKLTLRELAVMPKQLGREIEAGLDEQLRLVQQLYREGRPVHAVMRAASPSGAARSRVLGEAYGRDAATGLAPKSGKLAVDHIVPLNEIVGMKGFTELRPERQLEIVNDVKNLRAVDSLANSSRGDRSWSAWSQAELYYDSAALARMRALEEELRGYVASRIAALSRP